MAGPMFDTLTGRFEGVFRKLRSRGKLHPQQVEKALGDMRTALLEADAAVSVVDEFLQRVRDRSLSAEVMHSLSPAQQVVKIVRDELTQTLGGKHTPFTLPSASTRWSYGIRCRGSSRIGQGNSSFSIA